MAAINITTFGGMVPAVDDQLLPDYAAALARNAWLYSGKIEGLREETLLRSHTVTGAGKVFRIPGTYTAADRIFSDSTWLEFTNPLTDVIRAPVVSDTHDRYYWASSTVQPKYNTKARIENGDDPYLLGIPTPSTAPGLSATGGTGTAATRSYVQTWVSEYGEEGAPSPPVTVTGKEDDTWTFTLVAAAADDIGGPDRNLTHTRIYRTVTSASGTATFYLVAEVDITDLTYDDTDDDDTVTANGELESTAWTPPPTDLQGWVFLANGMVVGWRSNELWFCEPYRPHAWPTTYVQVVEYPIVGLGVINQTLVVCTLGNPMTASGVNPASISLSKLSNFEPCTSRRSILSAPEGVYYASPNGLIRVVPGSSVNIIRQLLDKDDWQELTGGGAIACARYGTSYFAFGLAQFSVFSEDAFNTDDTFEQEDFTDAFTGVLIDVVNERVALTTLESDDATVHVDNDPWTGELIILRDDKTYYLDQTTTTFTMQPFLWRSKIFQTSQRENFAACRVYFDVPSTAPDQNPTRNTDSPQELAADQYGLLRVYGNGELISTRELRTSGELFRLPSDRVYDFVQYEIEARVELKSFQAATSAKELKTL